LTARAGRSLPARAGTGVRPYVRPFGKLPPEAGTQGERALREPFGCAQDRAYGERGGGGAKSFDKLRTSGAWSDAGRC